MPNVLEPIAGAATAAYDVAGFRIRAHAESGDLLGPFHRLLGSFEVASLEQPAWNLFIGREECGGFRQLDERLRHVWSGEVMPDLRAVNYVGPGLRRLELCDCGWMEIDLSQGHVNLVLSTKAPVRRVAYFATLLLCEGLSAAGHCLLHAACLAAPVRGSMRSVLIVAKSGVGKSTAALALAQAGWRLMGDDIALVYPRNGRLRAWGFPRACHVRTPTLQLLPWLNELPMTATSIEGTFELTLKSLAQRAYPPTPEGLETAMIVCLDPTNPVDHCLRPLDRADCLIRLSEENVQPNEGYTDPVARRAFATIAQLVQQAPAYRLSVGPRLENLASHLSTHVKQ